MPHIAQGLSATALKRISVRWKRDLKEPEFRLRLLRRGLATTACQAGVGLEVVQRMMRHTNVSTTSRYVEVFQKRVADAHKAVESELGAGSK